MIFYKTFFVISFIQNLAAKGCYKYNSYYLFFLGIHYFKYEKLFEIWLKEGNKDYNQYIRNINQYIMSTCV